MITFPRLEEENRILDEAQKTKEGMIAMIRLHYFKTCDICGGTGTDSAYNMKCEKCNGTGNQIKKPDYFHVYKDDIVIVDYPRDPTRKIKICPKCAQHEQVYASKENRYKTYHDCKNEIVDVVYYTGNDEFGHRWIMQTIQQCDCFGPAHGEYK